MDTETMLELATEFAAEHPKFDDSFIISLAEQYEETGDLSIPQQEALKRIVIRWRMEDWRDGAVY